MSHLPHVPQLWNQFSVPPPPLPSNLPPVQSVQRNATVITDPTLNSVDGKRRKMNHQVKEERQKIIADYQEKINRLKELTDIVVTSRDTISEVELRATEEEKKTIEDTLNKLSERNQRRRRRKRKTKVPENSPKLTHEEQLKRREELHAKIDAWREKRHQDIILEDQKEKHKKLLGKMFIENEKRIKEAVEFITKLHVVKEKSQDPKVLGKINQLIAVWGDALAEYRGEKEKYNELLSVNSDNKQNVDEIWLKTLFGDSVKYFDWNPKVDLNQLITIRTHWDMYLSPEVDATPIPFFWVVPPPTPIDSWKEYQKRN